MNAACPLHCRSRNGAANGNTPAEPIEWAGLPANLDLAFSPSQRDKVYAQHLLLMRGTTLRRRWRDVEQLCVCEVTDYRHSDADRSVSGL